MRYRSIVILALICIVLGLVFLGIAFAKEKKDGEITTNAQSTQSVKLVKRIDIENIKSITIPVEGQELVLVKNNDGWHIDNDPETPLELSTIESITKKLELILASREIGKHPLDNYGLDKPSFTVTIATEREKTVLKFGNRSARADGYFFTLDDSMVYLVDSDLYDDLQFELGDMISLLDISNKDLSSVEMIMPSGTSYSVSVDDTDDLGIIDAIKGIKADSVIDYAAEDEGIYGLDKAVRITLSFADTDKLVILLGRGEDILNNYAKLDGSYTVYLIESEKIGELLQKIDGNDDYF